MRAKTAYFQSIVTALLLTVMISLPAAPVWAADDVKLNRLFEQLLEVEDREAHRIAGEIELELSKSGSASLDLLLKRGRDAFEVGKSDVAIEHLTALTDHAPDFSEGYYWRALAYIQAELFGPAFADLEQTLALRPRHYGAIEALGFLLEEMNRPRMAYEAYERVLAIHPHHRDVQGALERLGPEVGGKTL